MSKGLEALAELYSYIKPSFDYQTAKAVEDYKIIEKELKDYQEIKEIATHFSWNGFTSEIFNVETDEKYRDLFNGAIVYIQEDYRKARTFDIIKNKKLDVCSFINNFVERNDSYETYVLYFEQPIEIDYCVISEELLTEEEFKLVKEALKNE